MSRKKVGTCVECGQKHSNHKWTETSLGEELDERCFTCDVIVKDLKRYEELAGAYPLLGKPRRLVIEKYHIEMR